MGLSRQGIFVSPLTEPLNSYLKHLEESEDVRILPGGQTFELNGQPLEFLYVGKPLTIESSGTEVGFMLSIKYNSQTEDRITLNLHAELANATEEITIDDSIDISTEEVVVLNSILSPRDTWPENLPNNLRGTPLQVLFSEEFQNQNSNLHILIQLPKTKK